MYHLDGGGFFPRRELFSVKTREVPGKNIIHTRTMIHSLYEDLYGWIHRNKMIENSLNEASMVGKE